MQRRKKAKNKNLKWMKRTQIENDKKNAKIAMNKKCIDSKRCKLGRKKCKQCKKKQNSKNCKEKNASSAKNAKRQKRKEYKKSRNEKLLKIQMLQKLK